ncbi:MAG: 3D domain-containing protein [Kiritimatiellae bacterium]|nr:3D domain-containing protein [Kiritimatiellia bacterium]MBO7236682.1 3D domain-containing protein [Kiritimatiellia bacterium]
MAGVRGGRSKSKRRSWGKSSLREMSFWIMAVSVSVFLALCIGRFLPDIGRAFSRIWGERAVEEGLFEVTGYCNCGECCGWERDKNGNPVYNYGRLKGKVKTIGLTSTGKKAARGTVAADPKILKMGTKLEIPGYGTGVVEDIGGAIKGRHIDLWFPTHEEAKRWGKRYLRIKVIES